MSLVLNVEILGEYKKLTQATKGAQKNLNGLDKITDKVSSSMNKALGAIGVGLSLGVVVQQLKEASKAAVEDAKSQQLLANQLENTVGATKAQIAAVEQSIGKMQMSAAVADDTLRPAFAQLTRATGDTAESTKLLQLALDISAGSGKSLESVTMALTKAYNGQFGALGKLGVPMSDQILNASEATKANKELNKALMDQQIALETYGVKSKEYEKATQKVADAQDKVNRITAEGVDWQGQLQDAFAGSAEKAANTDPYQKMQIIFGEIQERIGAALLPLLEKFSAWLTSPGGTQALEQIVAVLVKTIEEGSKVVEFVLKYKEQVLLLAGAYGTMNIALKAYNTLSGLANTNSVTMATNFGKALGALGLVITALQTIDFLNKQIMAEGGWSRTEGQPSVDFSGQSGLSAPNPSSFTNMAPSATPKASTATPSKTPAKTTTVPKASTSLKSSPSPSSPVVINNNVTVKKSIASGPDIAKAINTANRNLGTQTIKNLKY